MKALSLRAIVCGLLLAAGPLQAANQSYSFESGETLHYDIFYHWGIIWKKAARGTLHLKEACYRGQDAYHMNLACKTLSFADKIMRVRDTLNAYTTRGVLPLHYEKISNEGSYWGKDVLDYIYRSNKTGGKVEIFRRNRPTRDTINWIPTHGYDMLSVFYYLRTLDYNNFKLFHTIALPIFTGRKVITMNVKYMGKTIVTLRNKKQWHAYRFNLSFVNDDNLKDEDPPIEVWMSNDKRKIPLKVEGKLPLGSLQAEYSGK